MGSIATCIVYRNGMAMITVANNVTNIFFSIIKSRPTRSLRISQTRFTTCCTMRNSL